jgi:hypothetical protein
MTPFAIITKKTRDSNSERTDKSSKKRKITKFLKDQELVTTVEKKRKKETDYKKISKIKKKFFYSKPR